MKNFFTIPQIIALMCLLCLWQTVSAQAPRFSTVAEKEAWIAKHPNAETQAIPASSKANDGRPSYIDTGNPAADQEAFRAAKVAYERKLSAESPAVAPVQNGVAKANTPLNQPNDPKKDVAGREAAAVSAAPSASTPIQLGGKTPAVQDDAYARAKTALYAEKQKAEDPEERAKAEKARQIADEDARMRAIEADAAQKKAAELSKNSDQ
jgi:hypothetical protein